MKFSIVTCTYNRDKYIGRTLKSVCDQTYSYSDFEVIVVDNNSSDKTGEVCKSYADVYADVNLRCITEPNQGISFALNRGIKEAQGEFIIYIDDDETIDSHYLEKLAANLLQFPEAQLCGTPVCPVYESKKPKWISRYTLRAITGYYYKGNKAKIVGASDFPGTGHTVIKKELYARFGNYNTELGRKGTGLLGAEDKDMSLRLMANNIVCYYFPDIPIYHHIPEYKLTTDFFHHLTYSIGKSERIRTKAMSPKAYRNRVIGEGKKWIAAVILFLGYTLCLSPNKGWKLIQFRRNVTKGLLGR